ncbi:MAG TPA: SAM-dependent methyltransferase [Thermodesulfobacteriota bacterium]
MNPRNDNFLNQMPSPGSFRDRSGFVFLRDYQIYRQVNKDYADNYEAFMGSGLYNELVKKRSLIEHEEVSIGYALSDDAYKIIKPRLIPFISYPYEWCFSQYKGAALLTLDIQRTAFDYGMSLKDASAYNIQFIDCEPVLIDTLSFEKYKEGEPWIAYRQFCQHFLGPLALICYKDVRLSQLMKVFIDGFPLDLVSSLLPFRTKTKFSLISHIHLHSKAQKMFSDKGFNDKKRTISRIGIISIIDSLKSAVQSLTWDPEKTVWSDYYDKTNYTERGFAHKREIVSMYLDELREAKSLWDFGSNVGEFSRIAARKGLQTISFDADPQVVEENYLKATREGEKNLLPLLCDLTNPSPDIGWENKERSSLLKRGPADTVLALAVIHHLAIANNVPLSNLAKFFSSICKALIIEFIPKSDTRVQKLLSTRQDIFKDYNQECFEYEFKNYFSVLDSVLVKDSERSIYLMRKLKPL